METLLSPTDQQSLVASFLEIAVGQTSDTARQFLQATSWKLDEAIQLFYVGGDSFGVGSLARSPASEDSNPLPEEISRENVQRESASGSLEQLGDGDGVRPPLPVIREALYDDALIASNAMRYPMNESSSVIAFRNFNEERKPPGIWESGQGVASTADKSRDNLASLYRPPFHMIFNGPFDKAKGAAAAQDKWLLVNLQSTTEFSSHMLNRDTWSNEAVSQTVSTNFIFWQVYDDTTEGQKVCTYYKLNSIPVVLVIDPITGQQMRSWKGMVQPERLLEDLLPYMDGGPRDHHVNLSHKRHRESASSQPQKTKDALLVADKKNEEEEEMLRALAMSMESKKEATESTSENEAVKSPTTQEEKHEKESNEKNNKPSYPALPEEPKGNKSLLCRVGVRLPDGRRVQRNFLRSDPIQLLWSFCCSHVKEAETRPFRLTQAIPGASKCLDFETQLTFEESGLANSMISVTWE